MQSAQAYSGFFPASFTAEFPRLLYLHNPMTLYTGPQMWAKEMLGFVEKGALRDRLGLSVRPGAFSVHFLVLKRIATVLPPGWLWLWP